MNLDEALEGQQIFNILTHPAPHRKGSRQPKEHWANGLPQWLRDTIDDLQPASARTDKAALTRCPRCGAYILDGWDGPGRHQVDPRRLNNQEELACLILGRQTLTLEARGSHGITLTRRDQWNSKTSAESSRLPVVASHDCLHPLGQVIPWEQIYPQPATGRTHHEPAPF